MNHLLGVVLVIAIADSLNPSTVVPALYFAAGERAVKSLFGFIAGVFLVYVAGGLVLVLGPGQALVALVPHPGAEARHLLEVSLGLALLVLAGALWVGRRHVARQVAKNEGRADRSSFLIGAGIVAIELPTAFPYFAAIAVIVDSGKNVSVQLGLVLAFNVAFVAPLVGVLGLRALAGSRGRQWLARLRGGLEERLAVLLPCLVLLAAAVLILLGTYGATTG